MLIHKFGHIFIFTKLMLHASYLYYITFMPFWNTYYIHVYDLGFGLKLFIFVFYINISKLLLLNLKSYVIFNIKVKIIKKIIVRV